MWSRAPASGRARPPKKRGRRDALSGEQNAVQVVLVGFVESSGAVRNRREYFWTWREREREEGMLLSLEREKERGIDVSFLLR